MRARTAAQGHDLVDEPLHDDILEAIRRRHRVVVAAVADQRRRRHPGGALLVRIQRHCGQITQRRKIGNQHRRIRGGRHEVGAGVFDQALDLAFIRHDGAGASMFLPISFGLAMVRPSGTWGAGST
jgi:hypothetical protein